jgi:predicted nucleic acid-binding protein
VIAVDTSVVYALLDRADSWHRRVTDWYTKERPTLATTPLVLAEVDHLAGARAGSKARTAWRADLRAGAYEVVWWPRGEEEIGAVAEQYEDLGVDLTDASLVVLCDRIGTVDIATIDERHFRAMQPLSGGSSFRLLPMDA